MTRDTTDRRTYRRTPRRTDDHGADNVRRIPTPNLDPEVPLVPETTDGDDEYGTYRADPFELALMEGSE
jgi:hypothetical protein